MPSKTAKRNIENYQHKGKKQVNNSPVGLVTPDTDKGAGKKTRDYNPHLDSTLILTSMAERTSFEAPTFRFRCTSKVAPSGTPGLLASNPTVLIFEIGCCLRVKSRTNTVVDLFKSVVRITPIRHGI